jgi:hypothetical protein
MGCTRARPHSAVRPMSRSRSSATSRGSYEATRQEKPRAQIRERSGPADNSARPGHLLATVAPWVTTWRSSVILIALGAS